MQADQTKVIPLPFEEVAARLKQGVADAGMLLVHEINPQGALHTYGFEIEQLRIILFFLPSAMHKLSATAPAGVLEAPLKIVVQALTPDSTAIFWRDPAATVGQYPNMAEEVAALQHGQQIVLATVGA